MHENFFANSDVREYISLFYFYLIIVSYSSDSGATNFNLIFNKNPINTIQDEFHYFYEKC
jgi:hypothetical protein